MTDIVERLRAQYEPMDLCVPLVLREAADEIERLRTQLAIQFGMHPGGDLAKASQAEIEQLTAALHWWQSIEQVRLHAEIERLRAVNHSNVDFAEQAKAHLNDARNLVATLRAELREAGLLR